MVSWILVAVVVVAAILLFIKFKEFGHKSKFSLLLVVLAIFLITVGFVWFKTRPDLTSYQGFLSLGRAYYSWAASLFGNMGSITGYAVQQDWGVSNATASVLP